jgi:hypothetical protein
MRSGAAMSGLLRHAGKKRLARQGQRINFLAPRGKQA